MEIRFGGRVEENLDYYGNCHAELRDYYPLSSPSRAICSIAGYGGGRSTPPPLGGPQPQLALTCTSSPRASTSRAWSSAPAEVITKVLYPADDHMEGKTLAGSNSSTSSSATAQTIVRQHRKQGRRPPFAEHHVVHINDTHPTLMIPELMRIFMDEDGLGWDEA